MADAVMFDPIEVGDFDEAIEKANKVLPPNNYRTKVVSAQHKQGPKAQ